MLSAHPEVATLLAAVLLPELPPELAAHLAGCAACRRLVALAAPLAPAVTTHAGRARRRPD
jgi:hypothetical protein